MSWEQLIDRAAVVGARLKARGERVAVAETSAGGLISAALLAVPGASAYFVAGGVVYTGVSKQTLMGVTDEAMAAARAATEVHALHLAEAARARLQTEWGIGETGAAGPSGNRFGETTVVPRRRATRVSASRGRDDGRPPPASSDGRDGIGGGGRPGGQPLPRLARRT